MALRFRPSTEAISSALEMLKSDGVVHRSARFNAAAPDELRREVAFYDRDFLYRLGRTSEEEGVVADALTLLRDQGLVETTATYDAAAVARHREEVRETFDGAWTSFSTTMERLVYMLTSVRRPQHLVELGSFWGYTLAWFAGPCVGSARSITAERIIGIDVDEKMTSLARKNFARLPNSERVRLICEDARTALDEIPGPIDFLYIEAKSDDQDGLYLELLERAYGKLSKGAWVIAHDSLDWTFASEMRRYLPFVRESGRFSESVAFEIDSCGLELSIK